MTHPDDRLRSLPLDMRTEILSFLPPHYAVQTSVLSTDWENSWKFLKRIYLDDKSPFNSEQQLLKFYDRLMGAFQGGYLDHFYLHFHLPRILPITSWIDDAICRHVRELDLQLPELDMPESFFICGTITMLRLRVARFVMDDWEHRNFVINLPNLSSFDTSAHHTVASIVIRIIEGSRSLKSIKLSGCSFLPLVQPMPKSLNVTTLDFADTTLHGYATIFHVLDSCPSVKNLSIGKLEESNPARPYPPRCMIKTLKTLEVTYYTRCHGPEYKFLLYVLSGGLSNAKNGLSHSLK